MSVTHKDQGDFRMKQKDIQRFYMFIFFSNILSQIDVGILPAASINIQDEVGLTDAQFGVLGSSQYAGNIIGSLIASYFF